jgi:hypothetical protein
MKVTFQICKEYAIFICTPVIFLANLLVSWSTSPIFHGGYLKMATQLSGGVNLDDFRLAFPDLHQSIALDNWVPLMETLRTIWGAQLEMRVLSRIKTLNSLQADCIHAWYFHQPMGLS